MVHERKGGFTAVKRPLLRCALWIVGGYVTIIVVMALLENWLVYPAPRFPIGEWDQQRLAVEDARFTADDGTELHGWFVGHADAAGTVLYFHGNGENTAHQIDLLSELHERLRLNVLVFDWRGYGKSEGKPSEAGIQRDARAALRWLNERTGTNPQDVVFYGRSLGAAVAIELAEAEGCRALVLHSAFASLPDVAARHYPWLPVNLIMRNRYPSIERIGNCPQPLLQVHGAADHIVPIESGRRLFEAATSPEKTFIELPDGGHNDGDHPQFRKAFRQFIKDNA